MTSSDAATASSHEMSIKVQHTDLGLLIKLQNGLAPPKIDPVIERVALETFRMVVEATPKKWFGQLRREWSIKKPAIGVRHVINTSKIMLWIEEGTQAHGPVTKKALFIPLTKRALAATSGIHGFTRNAEIGGNSEKGVSGPASRTRGIQILVGGGRSKVRQVTLVYGVDYILVKRVKGIQARHIVAKQREVTKALLLNAFKEHIRTIING
jgi:hypothetical protein